MKIGEYTSVENINTDVVSILDTARRWITQMLR
jgi:predicted nucleic acid-binding Zn ribbon protein